MVIKTKKIVCATREIFNTWKLPSGPTDTSADILWSSVVYIENTAEIWTHGRLFGGLFSNEDDNRVSLSIGGVTKVLSLHGHTQSYTTLTGSTSIKDQAILSSGEANKWVLKTLGKNAFSNDSYLLADGTAKAAEKVINSFIFSVKSTQVAKFDGSAEQSINLVEGDNVHFSTENGNITISADKNSDTVNTAGATNKVATKLFIIGAQAQTASPQTYSNQYIYIGSDNCLYSLGKKVLTDHQTIYNLDIQTKVGENTTKVVTYDPNSANNSITLVQGSNVTLASNTDNKTITISSENTTYDFYNLIFKQGESVIDTYKPTTSPNKILKAGTNITFTGGNNEIVVSSIDTKNTAGATDKLDTKMFLIGATNQNGNIQTYTNSNVYIGTNNKLYSNGKEVSTSDHTHNYAGSSSPGGAALTIALNPNGLLSATYGSYGGILQDSSNGPLSGVWSNRIKILHNDASGYYTELAQNFTGTAGLWHRRNSGGTVTDWVPVIDKSNFKTYLDGTYVIRGNDPNVLTNYVRYSISTGLTMSWEWGNATPTHIWGTKGSDSSKAYVFNGDNIRAFANAVNKAGDTMTGELISQTGGIWVQGGSAAGGNVGRMSLVNGMPNGLAYNTSKRGVRVYSNAIAFADPYNGNSNNDAGWIRHIEETANSGQLEIAVGDDNSNETIVVRRYGGNAVGKELYLFNSAGNSTFPGTLSATQLISTVATGTAPLSVASTTLCPNLNADMIDGLHSSSFITFRLETAYTAARFLTSDLAKKAASTYIEWWQSGAGWFNFQIGNLTSNGYIYASSSIRSGEKLIIPSGDADNSTKGINVRINNTDYTLLRHNGTDALILSGHSSNNTIYIRPNGTTSSTGQVTINKDGNISTSGIITSGNFSTSGKYISSFASKTWINSVTNSALTLNISEYGGIWCAPTKGGRVTMSVYPNSNNNVYLGYASSAQISAGTNSFNKQTYWNADDGFWRSSGYVKDGSSDAYILLGGGGHSALSNYFRYIGNNVNADWNSITITGNMRVSEQAVTNGPTNAYNYGQLLTFNAGGTLTQMYLPHSAPGSMYIRTGWSGVSQYYNWVQVITTGNYTSLLDPRYVKKEGDTMTGALTIASSAYNRQLVIKSTGSDSAENQAGIVFTSSGDASQDLRIRGERFDSFLAGYGLVISGGSKTKDSDSLMYLYNTGRYISKVATGTKPIDVVSTTLCNNLNADMVDGKHNGEITAAILKTIDTRSTQETPSSLPRGLEAYFKVKSTIGLSGSDYTGVLSFRPWGDFSGGPTYQVAFTDSPTLYVRQGTSSGWGSWKQIAYITDTVSNSDMLDGYHASDLWRSNGGKWNPSANISLGATANNQEWSFDISRNGFTGCYWHVWDSTLSTMLKVNADNGKVYAPYGFVGDLSGSADTLDGYHASSFESYKLTTINASSLNNNTWYPVTMDIGNSQQTRIRIEGNTAANASWNSRSDKKMSLILDYTVNGSSWGWTSAVRNIFAYQEGAGCNKCLRGLGQLTNSSTEYVYVRGGAVYNFYVSRFITPVLRTSTYTVSSQSVAPTTTTPADITRNIMYTSDKVSSATNADTATKLGSSTVGGTSKPIYLNSGSPTALSSTIGSSSKPVYLNAGTITACTGSDVLSSISSSWATNLSITVAGYTRNLSTIYADYANSLRYTKTIWGQNFNGTGNVSGNLTGVGSITMTGTISGITRIDGTTASTGDLIIKRQGSCWSQINVGGTYATNVESNISLNLKSQGTVQISAGADNNFLWVTSSKVRTNKSFYSGNTQITSDIRLKNRISSLSCNMNEALKFITPFYYTKKGEGDDIRLGVSANDVRHVFPELVSELHDPMNKYCTNYYTVDYAALGAVVAINGYKELRKLVDARTRRINKLELRIAKLTRKVRDLSKIIDSYHS